MPRFAYASHRPGVDRVFLWTAGLLVVFGLIALSSASNAYSFSKYGTTWRVLFHQVVSGLLPGLALAWVCSRTDYHRWGRHPLLLIAASVALLWLVFVPGLGLTLNNARSWIQLGGMSFQPAEIIKLTATIGLAGWLQRRGHFGVRRFWTGFVPFALLLAAIAAPIVLQPDFGTLVVVVLIAVAVYYAAGAKLWHLLTLAAAGAVGAWAMVIAAPYRFNRLLIFLDPALDPQGIGYHLNQALLAVGSGGWFGRGFGKSLAKFLYLPEVAADSVFAIIAEEIGFVAVVAVVGAYLLLLWRGLRIARDAPDPYGRLLATGLTVWLVLQAFLNMMAMIGLAPLTGIPMPFVSAGGTALAANLSAVGLLANISRARLTR